MSLFSDSLKKWFYHNDSVAAKAGTRICLLDASGNPAGSDEILRALTFVNSKDDYVDMGLPSKTLWAKKNLGAVSETDYGMYCSWGNVELHPAGDGYDFSVDIYNNTPAASISANLTLEQDIAHATLGGGWRMPTTNECVELFNSEYTTVTLISDYQGTGVNGYVVTSNSNGNTIFIPAAGIYDGTSRFRPNLYGYYWSSSYYSASKAYSFGFIEQSLNASGNNDRRLGFSIRPVL